MKKNEWAPPELPPGILEKFYELVRKHISTDLSLEMKLSKNSAGIIFTLDGCVHQSISVYEMSRIRNVERFARHIAWSLLENWLSIKYWKL